MKDAIIYSVSIMHSCFAQTFFMSLLTLSMVLMFASLFWMAITPSSNGHHQPINIGVISIICLIVLILGFLWEIVLSPISGALGYTMGAQHNKTEIQSVEDRVSQLERCQTELCSLQHTDNPGHGLKPAWNNNGFMNITFPSTDGSHLNYEDMSISYKPVFFKLVSIRKIGYLEHLYNIVVYSDYGTYYNGFIKTETDGKIYEVPMFVLAQEATPQNEKLIIVPKRKWSDIWHHRDASVTKTALNFENSNGQ